MKKTLLAATIAAFATAAASQQLDGIPTQLHTALKAVADSLKDPESARFRNLRPVGLHLCGEVNGKNSYGGYAGFNPFVVRLDGSNPLIPSDYMDIRPYREICGHE